MHDHHPAAIAAATTQDNAHPDAAALRRYFDLIGYRHRGAADLAALCELHRRHMLAIPFENLSPLTGSPVRLDLPALVDKFSAKRGGYCYEQNLVFQHALEALGFQVTALLARVRLNAPEGVVTPRTHMLVAVALEDATWIADTGFGRMTPTAPLRLTPGLLQDTPHGRCRLMADEDGYRLEGETQGTWQPLYIFNLVPGYPSDIKLANWYVSTHPDSHFTRDLVAVRTTASGRHVLYNTRYSVYPVDGPPQMRQIGGADQLLELLRSAFGIDAAGLPGVREQLERIVQRDGTT